MADVVLNDAKGRVAEIANDGGNFKIVPLSAVDSDANIVDGYAGGSNLDDVLGDAANTEQTGSTWARKDHLNANVTVTVDDTNNKVILILDNDDTWTGVAASNDVVALLLVEWVTVDSDSPVLAKFDFAVTTDGNDVTANYDQTNGVWQSA